MADAIRAQPADAPVDVAVMHDPARPPPRWTATVPLVLSGHYHRREQHLLPDGTLSFVQGSTGASGLRGLEHEKPTPVRASVLYFDRDTRALQAWDDITLGGLGLVSAKIERRIVGQQFPELAPFVTPSPTESASSGTPVSPPPSLVGALGSAPPSSAPCRRCRRRRPARDRGIALVIAGGVPYAFGVPDGKGRRGPSALIV